MDMRLSPQFNTDVHPTDNVDPGLLLMFKQRLLLCDMQHMRRLTWGFTTGVPLGTAGCKERQTNTRRWCVSCAACQLVQT